MGSVKERLESLERQKKELDDAPVVITHVGKAFAQMPVRQTPINENNVELAY